MTVVQRMSFEWLRSRLANVVSVFREDSAKLI
jgi:hypothetical protein